MNQLLRKVSILKYLGPKAKERISKAATRGREKKGFISRKGGSRSSKRWLLRACAALVLLGVIGGGYLFMTSGERTASSLSYSAFLTALDNGEVATLNVQPEKKIDLIMHDGQKYRVTFPVEATPSFLERVEAGGADLTLHSSRNLGLLVELGITIGLISLLLIFMVPHLKDSDSNGSGKAQSTTTFADVAGADEIVAEVKEMVAFLQHQDHFANLGARTPKGVLLSGPPGTGKTLIARAVAGEAGVPFYTIAGASVTGFIVGLGAQKIRSVFKKARKKGGVIFIDEIDALGSKRGTNSSHSEDDRTLNQLLVEMDGFNTTEGVIVIGATNRPEALDPALTRPGRFDRQITVGLPTPTEREAILTLHATQRAMPLDSDVNLARLAKLLPGSSGADLENLLNESAIAAGRRGGVRVLWNDIEKARDRLMLGRERPGFKVRDEEWKLVAWHEAGHALAGLLFCPEDGLHKVTIQARGRSLGVAHFAPADDVALHSREYLAGQLVKLMAGRAAEERLVGPQRVTSGAEQDLVQANNVAKRMVMRLGMAGETGTSLLVYDDSDGHLSPETHARMEKAVEVLLVEALEKARKTLEEHADALVALATALRERETLDGQEVLEILEVAGFSLGVKT